MWADEEDPCEGRASHNTQHVVQEVLLEGLKCTGDRRDGDCDAEEDGPANREPVLIRHLFCFLLRTLLYTLLKCNQSTQGRLQHDGTVVLEIIYKISFDSFKVLVVAESQSAVSGGFVAILRLAAPKTPLSGHGGQWRTRDVAGLHGSVGNLEIGHGSDTDGNLRYIQHGYKHIQHQRRQSGQPLNSGHRYQAHGRFNSTKQGGLHLHPEHEVTGHRRHVLRLSRQLFQGRGGLFQVPDIPGTVPCQFCLQVVINRNRRQLPEKVHNGINVGRNCRCHGDRDIWRPDILVAGEVQWRGGGTAEEGADVENVCQPHYIAGGLQQNLYHRDHERSYIHKWSQQAREQSSEQEGEGGHGSSFPGPVDLLAPSSLRAGEIHLACSQDLWYTGQTNCVFLDRSMLASYLP